MERYTVLRQLAVTKSGRILLCEDSKTGKQVVVKRVKSGSWRRAPSVSMERRVHRHLLEQDPAASQWIVDLVDAFNQQGHEHLVLEYCARGELFDLVERMPEGRLEREVAQSYFKQICQAVKYMHDCGIAHCDLSLENVLVTEEGVLKISDFGLSMETDQRRRHAVGKIFYMAPEMHTSELYDPSQADVWSLGVMLFIMLTGSPPFESSEANDAVMQFVHNKGWEALITAWDYDELVPSDLLFLIKNMLHVDPDQRWTLAQVLSHPFLNEDSSENNDPASDCSLLAQKMASIGLSDASHTVVDL